MPIKNYHELHFIHETIRSIQPFHLVIHRQYFMNRAIRGVFFIAVNMLFFFVQLREDINGNQHCNDCIPSSTSYGYLT